LARLVEDGDRIAGVCRLAGQAPVDEHPGPEGPAAVVRAPHAHPIS
jgi:hypothetical protein